MNGTNVSSAILDRLTADLPSLSPEAQKAATFMLEHPMEIGVSTVREIAAAAQVKPNTLVRLARVLGFEGYDDFRAPFRDAIRNSPPGFESRARWLQDLRAEGRLGDLYADTVQTALRSIEDTFAGITPDMLAAAADTIWTAQHVYTLGVGVNNANARNFTYLASTGMIQFHAIPRPGNTALDDLAFAGPQDVLIAMTSKPYRTEVIDAVHVAREQGVTLIGISDSPASPILHAAQHRFIAHTDSPQFFPSSVATIALLETLLSFVIAAASPDIVERVETFHARRFALGLYHAPPQSTSDRDTKPGDQTP